MNSHSAQKYTDHELLGELSKLPNEIIEHIFRFLPIFDKLRFMGVSSAWKEHINLTIDDYIYHLNNIPKTVSRKDFDTFVTYIKKQPCYLDTKEKTISEMTPSELILYVLLKETFEVGNDNSLNALQAINNALNNLINSDTIHRYDDNTKQHVKIIYHCLSYTITHHQAYTYCRPEKIRELKPSDIKRSRDFSEAINKHKCEIILALTTDIITHFRLHLPGMNLSGLKFISSEDPIRIDFSQANFYRVNLCDTQLINCNLNDVNLSKAFLHSTSLNQSHLCYADLSHLTFRFVKLNNADLTYANLSFSKFIFADCKEACFKNACLIHTSFYADGMKNSDLTGAIFDGADFFDVNKLVNDPKTAINDCSALISKDQRETFRDAIASNIANITLSENLSIDTIEKHIAVLNVALNDNHIDLFKDNHIATHLANMAFGFFTNVNVIQTKAECILIKALNIVEEARRNANRLSS